MFESGSNASHTDWIREALHDLCQPLTALECRLYLGTMGEGGGEATADDMR